MLRNRDDQLRTRAVVERVSDEDGSFSQPIDVYVKNNPGKLKHALDLLEDLYDF